MGDIRLCNNHISGEIEVQNGAPVTDDGLSTAVFISLFSGSKGEWWGNLLSSDIDYQYGGEFEKLAQGAVITTDSVKLMVGAILRDLEWMKRQGLVKEITVQPSISNINHVNFSLNIIRPDGGQENLKFSNNWKAHSVPN